VSSADRHRLREIYVACRADEFRALALSDAQRTGLLHMQFEAQQHHYTTYFGDAEFLLVEYNGEVAGRMTVQRSTEQMLLVDIAVLPAFRGQGIATALLGVLIAESKERGLPLRCHVDPGNPARRLYERLGLRVVGQVGVDLLLELA
jgi:ribosomal protein S18 acetylase RimI-like enzyme